MRMSGSMQGNKHERSETAQAAHHLQALRLQMDSDYIAREELGFDTIQPPTTSELSV